MSNVKEEIKKISQHGVLINHNNIGLLIQGESGIGKSECAIELINRGAFLISDDIVIIRKDNASLIGESPKETKELIDIWGKFESEQNPELRKDLIQEYGSKLIFLSNKYASSMESVGLKGPYSE